MGSCSFFEAGYENSRVSGNMQIVTSAPDMETESSATLV